MSWKSPLAPPVVTCIGLPKVDKEEISFAAGNGYGNLESDLLIFEDKTKKSWPTCHVRLPTYAKWVACVPVFLGLVTIGCRALTWSHQFASGMMTSTIENIWKTVLDKLFDCLNIWAVLKNFWNFPDHVDRLTDSIFENRPSCPSDKPNKIYFFTYVVAKWMSFLDVKCLEIDIDLGWILDKEKILIYGWWKFS